MFCLCARQCKTGRGCDPCNSTYSAVELVHQLNESKAKTLFTCIPLLPKALEAVIKVGIPKKKIYLLEIPHAVAGNTELLTEYRALYFVGMGLVTLLFPNIPHNCKFHINSNSC